MVCEGELLVAVGINIPVLNLGCKEFLSHNRGDYSEVDLDTPCACGQIHKN